MGSVNSNLGNLMKIIGNENPKIAKLNENKTKQFESKIL